MRMKGKGKKRLLWTAVIVLGIVAGGYWAMELGVSYVLNMMQGEAARSLEMADDAKPPDTGEESDKQTLHDDETGPLAPAGEKTAGQHDDSEAEQPPADSQDESEPRSGEQDRQPAVNPPAANVGVSPSGQETATEAPAEMGQSDDASTGQVSPPQPDSQPIISDNDEPGDDDANGKEAAPQESADVDTSGYTAHISAEKGGKVQEDLTIKEKLRLTSVILKSFSPSELKQMSQMASDGISVEEKKAVKDLFLEKLSEQEYNELIAIAAKYGLSQGKSYEESKQE